MINMYFESDECRERTNDISFFGSQYYLWLRSNFGEAAEDRLKTEFSELYAAREEFEKNQKNYPDQVRNMICDIEDMKKG